VLSEEAVELAAPLPLPVAVASEEMVHRRAMGGTKIQEAGAVSKPMECNHVVQISTYRILPPMEVVSWETKAAAADRLASSEGTADLAAFLTAIKEPAEAVGTARDKMAKTGDAVAPLSE